MIYLVIKQNRLNIAAKVEFMKMSTSHERDKFVSWLIETKSDIQSERISEANVEESNLRGLPFDHGTESLETGRVLQ